jgi:hypothetical protein
MADPTLCRACQRQGNADPCGRTRQELDADRDKRIAAMKSADPAAKVTDGTCALDAEFTVHYGAKWLCTDCEHPISVHPPAAAFAPAQAQQHVPPPPQSMSFPLTDAQTEAAARMTVSLSFRTDDAPCLFTGCLILGDENYPRGAVLTCAHVFVTARFRYYRSPDNGRIDAQHASDNDATVALRIAVTSDEVQKLLDSRQYTDALDGDPYYGIDDWAILVPDDGCVLHAPLSEPLCTLSIPRHTQLVYHAWRNEIGRAPGGCRPFHITSGFASYASATVVVSTAFADNGWSGGPVFHFGGVDAKPCLVGIVRGKYGGTTNHRVQVQLLPLAQFASAASCAEQLKGELNRASSMGLSVWPPLFEQTATAIFASAASAASTNSTLPPRDAMGDADDEK